MPLEQGARWSRRWEVLEAGNKRNQSMMFHLLSVMSGPSGQGLATCSLQPISPLLLSAPLPVASVQPALSVMGKGAGDRQLSAVPTLQLGSQVAWRRGSGIGAAPRHPALAPVLPQFYIGWKLLTLQKGGGRRQKAGEATWPAPAGGPVVPAHGL